MSIWHALLLSIFVALPARALPITVSAAISLKDAIEEITSSYGKHTGQEVELNFGSSGQLMTQIRRGAPVDLFISAAPKQVNELVAESLLDRASIQVLATNRLVLVVPRDAPPDVDSFEGLTDERFKRICIGQPDSVPAGEYAMQVLMKLGIAEALKPRLIFGANVRQVLSYVERGEVEAGIVYRTDALMSGDKVRVVATADPSWHAPIEYPAAVVTASGKREQAEQFLRFLRTEPARQILTKFGFGIPDDALTTQPAR